MLTLSSPIVNPEGYSAAGIPASPNLIPNFAPLAVATAIIPIPLLPPSVIVLAIPPPIVSGVITVPAPVGVILSTVTIDGITYTFTLDLPVPPGTFTVIDGALQIGYLGLVPPFAIGYYGMDDLIPTNFVPAPYPAICSEFPINGELTWTLTFEEQPSANIKFITDASQKASVINYFTVARNIDIYGVSFCPAGQLSIVEISTTRSKIPLIEVSVSLTGISAHLLDRYITVGIRTFLTDCTAPPAELGNSPTRMTVADAASRLGIPLTGVEINISPNTLRNPATPISLGSLLESQSIRGVGAFIDFNNGIKLVNYGSAASHAILESQVRSDVTTNTSVKIGAAPFFKTYDPLTKVTFGDNPPIPRTAVPAPSWQPVPIVVSRTTDGDPNAAINPYGGIQKDLSIVFDISGKRKRYKETRLINGQPISEFEGEYGYVAVGRDDIQFELTDAAGSPIASPQVNRINGRWTVIESTNTDYRYNDLGYLVEVVTRGGKLARFRTENAQKPESLAVRIDPTTPDRIEVAQLDTFRFFIVPISKVETYELAKMSDYYNDIVAPRVERTICLPDGQQVTIPVVDESYIEPYFALKKTVTESGFASTPDPKSTALKPLPNLTTGKNSLFIERTTIGARSRSILNGFATLTNPTEYTKSTDNYAAADGQFSNMLSIAESSIVSGRPSVASSKGPTRQIVTPPAAPTPLPDPVPFAVKSGLTSEDTGFVTVGSVNFPTAATEAEALRAAQIDIDIINFKSGTSESLLVDFRPTIRPGDTVSYRVNGDTRQGMVISATNTLTVNGLTREGINVSSVGTQLKLGRMVSTPVVRVDIPRPTSTLRL